MAIFGRSYSRPVTVAIRQPASVIVSARAASTVSVSSARVRSVAATRPITLQHTGLGVTGRNAAALIANLPAYTRMQPIRDYTQVRQGHGPIKTVSVATTIALAGGNNESALVNTSVLIPPSVLVTDQFGFAIPGIAVTFAVTAGGGSVNGPSQVTNAFGVAMVGGWQLGSIAGVNTLTATSAGLAGSPVLFTATAIAQANPPLPDGPPILPHSHRGLTFQQTDSAAVIQGPAGSVRPANGQTVNLLCVGTPGTVMHTVTLDAAAKDKWAVAFDIPVPNFSLWHGGDWAVRLNIASGNACATWNRTELYRTNSGGVVQSLIGSAAGHALVLGNPGIRTAWIRGEPQYLRSYGDRVIAVLSFANQGTLPPYNLTIASNVPQTFGFIADQVIDSPFRG